MGSIPLPALGVKVPEPPDSIQELGKVVALKNLLNQGNIQQQTQQQNEITLQNERLAQQDQMKMRQAMIDSNGDPDKFMANVQAAGVNPQTVYQLRSTMLEARKKMADIDNTELDVQSKRNSQLIQAMQGMLAAPADPVAKQAAYAGAISKIQQGKLMTPAQMAGLPQQYPGDDWTKLQMASLMTHDQFLNQQLKANEIQEKGATAYKSSFELAGQLLGPTSNQQQWEQGLSALKASGAPAAVLAQFPQQWSQADAERAKMLAVSPEKFFSLPVEKLAMNSWLSAHPGKTPADFMKEMKSWAPLINLQMQKNLLTPDAIDAAAENYYFTGQMPPGIFRSPGMVSQIINRSAQLHPGEDIAHNRAVFSARESALKQMQTQASKLDAFEKVAKANLQQFIDAGSKIYNSKSPLINMALDKINKNLLSSDERNAYDAAYTVGSTETARVLANLGSAGVLSDDARNELGKIIDPHASLSARLAAAKIVMQDFNNRKQGFDMTLKNLEDSLRSRPASKGNESGVTTDENQSQDLGDDLSKYPVFQPK